MSYFDDLTNMFGTNAPEQPNFVESGAGNQLGFDPSASDLGGFSFGSSGGEPGVDPSMTDLGGFGDGMQTGGAAGSAIPTDAGIGMAGTSAQAMPARTVKPPKPMNMLGKIGAAIEAFGAGGRGQTPLFMKMKQMEMEQRQARQQEMLNNLSIGEKLAKLAQPLAGDPIKHQQFIENAVGQYAGDDPMLGNFYRMAMNRPDLLSVLPTYAAKSPLFKPYIDAGDRDGLIKTMNSEAGHKELNKQANDFYLKEFQTKLPKQVAWMEKNDPETLARIQKDGVVTIAELRELHDKLPLNMQLSDAGLTNITQPENQDRLVGIHGFSIAPDKTVLEQQKAKASADRQAPINIEMPDTVDANGHKVKGAIHALRPGDPRVDELISKGGVIARRAGTDENDIRIMVDPNTNNIVAVNRKNLGVTDLTDGNKRKDVVNKQALDFEKELEQRNVISTESWLQQVEGFLHKRGYVDQDGTQVKPLPGIGTGVSMLPTGTLGKDARDFRRLLSKGKNIEIKNRSGATVTPPEFQRNMEEWGQGSFIQKDEDVLNALKELRTANETVKTSIVAGHPVEAVELYRERGGDKILRPKVNVGDIITVKGHQYRITQLDKTGGNNHAVEPVQ